MSGFIFTKMAIHKSYPSRVYLPSDSDEVVKFLTFADRGAGFLLHRLKQNRGWARSDFDGWKARYDQIKSEQKKCILFRDEQGRPYTYAGLWKDLQDRFGWELVTNIESIEPKLIPTVKSLPPPRYYQTEATNALIAGRHCSIELPTGSGKTLILLMLARHFGLKTVVMTPSASITDAIYKKFVEHFGQKYVGQLGDGKKKTDRLFTICTAQSLTRVKEGSPAWDDLIDTKVFVVDESHTIPAETFTSACLGVMRTAPYRFFVSATQTRTDGSEMVLKGLTGPIVYSQEFRTLVDQKFLAKPIFKLFHVGSNPRCGVSSDPNKETRNQLYINPNVAQLVGQIVEKAVRLSNRQVLILIEEFEQFLLLRNYLTIPYLFAHGVPSKDAKKFLPEEYWDSDVEDCIKKFNNGECKVLVGTSVLGVGVDLLPVGCLVYLRGGSSEIQVRQGLGRGTRIVDGKTDFWHIDINIKGSAIMERHFANRVDIYNELSDDLMHYGR